MNTIASLHAQLDDSEQHLAASISKEQSSQRLLAKMVNAIEVTPPWGPGSRRPPEAQDMSRSTRVTQPVSQAPAAPTSGCTRSRHQNHSYPHWRDIMGDVQMNDQGCQPIFRKIWQSGVKSMTIGIKIWQICKKNIENCYFYTQEDQGRLTWTPQVV